MSIPLPEQPVLKKIKLDDVKETPLLSWNENDKSNNNDHQVYPFLPTSIPFSTFQSEYFEKKPFVAHNVHDLRFSTEDFLAILAHQKLEVAQHMMVCKYTEEHERETWTCSDDTTVASREMMASKFEAGFSVQFHQPQRYDDPLYRLNLRMEEIFGSLAGASAYLTPANSRALPPHHDDVEVFVFQTEGTKHWKVHAPVMLLPGEPSGDFTMAEIGPVLFECTLNVGDILYLPRGFVHYAVSDLESRSTHVTVSTYQHNSWANLMEFALPRVLTKAFDSNSEFRKGLPMRYLTYMGSAAKNTNQSEQQQLFLHRFKDLVSSLVDHVSLDEIHHAADLASMDFYSSRLPPSAESPNRSTEDQDDQKPLDNINRFQHQQLRFKNREYIRLLIENDSVHVYHSFSNIRIQHMGQVDPSMEQVDHEEGEDYNESRDEEMEPESESDSEEEFNPRTNNVVEFSLASLPVLTLLFTSYPEYQSFEQIQSTFSHIETERLVEILLRLLSGGVLDMTSLVVHP